MTRLSDFFHHILAIYYRKTLIYWKTPVKHILAIIFAIFIFISPLFIQDIFKSFKNKTVVINSDFSAFPKENITLVQIRNPDCDQNSCFPELKDELIKMIHESHGIYPQYLEFDNFTEFDKWQYSHVATEHSSTNIPFAYQVTNGTYIDYSGDEPTGFVEIKQMYNDSQSTDIFLSILQRAAYRAWNKNNTKADIKVSYTFVPAHESTEDENYFFASSIKYVGYFALITMLSMIYGNIAEDFNSPVRNYLMSCGMSGFAYWIGNYISDLIYMIFFSVVTFIINVTQKNSLFKTIPSISFFSHTFSIIVSIPYVYIWGWFFKNKSLGQTIFIIYHIMYAVIMIVVQLVSNSDDNSSVSILTKFSVFCPLCIYYSVFDCILDYQYTNQSIPKNMNFLKTKYAPVFNVLIASFFTWPSIVIIIEFVMKKLKERIEKSRWVSYRSAFDAIKKTQVTTQEAIDMEERIKNANPNDYAIMIKDVSKYFSDASRGMIYAVNQVSLGIERGSIFGFLGSNGAGKTTLMKMILREVQATNGNIYVNGNDVLTNFDPKSISICPQFDDHLTYQMTGMQNLKFFSLLFNKDNKQMINKLINDLDLHEHINKPVATMSGGNRRKIAVAVAFLSDADIILLDEPTSSLDPIARHKVHNLINEFKGRKTFMLCTHLLEEAESLCDNISIMLNGSIHTIGTPQYLSNKFGTEWKVDILLTDTYEETQEKVTKFFKEKLPSAVATISRPLSRIYSIPSADIDITDLFKVISEGQKTGIGIKYYTCSCSTLEKVFLELSMASEQFQRVTYGKHDEPEPEQMPVVKYPTAKNCKFANIKINISWLFEL